MDAIIKIFLDDSLGDVSLEVVKLLTRMTKERRYNISANVLECLPHLRLLHELAPETENGDRPRKSQKRNSKAGPGRNDSFVNKKERKRRKENAAIEKELKEAVATVDQEERDRRHSETLKLVFLIYFRILKSSSNTDLLGVALRGLVRFGHLISVDFFKDLLAMLKKIAQQDISITMKLQCISTAFELLSGQGTRSPLCIAAYQLRNS